MLMSSMEGMGGQRSTFGVRMDSHSSGGPAIIRGGGHRKTALPGAVTGGRGGVASTTPTLVITGGGPNPGITVAGRTIAGGNGGAAAPSAERVSGGGKRAK